MDLLKQGCEALGFQLTPEQLRQFQSYYNELVEWNQKFNLTAITEFHDVQVKHFLDSLSSLPILAEELALSLPLQTDAQMVDVGAGAGFPSIPLKIAAPQLRLTLMDGTQKKIHFLQHLIQILDLKQTTTVKGRAEELGRQSLYREQFDIVTARAVASLNTLVEYLLPLVRIDGYAMIYKGGNAAAEFMQARKAIGILGGETVRFAPVDVPFLDQQRHILLIKKVQPTPPPYPRGQGMARKKPLQ